MKLRTGLAALLLLAGMVTGHGVQAEPGGLDPAAVQSMDLDATVYNLALSRNALGVAMLEYDKRHPDSANETPIAVAPTPGETARVAKLSDTQLEARIEALSAEITNLTSHGQALQQQGQALSPAMTEVARKLGANVAISNADLGAAMAGRNLSSAAAPAPASSGEALCVTGQQVEFVHLNRRWPGTVKGHSYGGDQCLVTSNMNTGSYMQDLEIDFADLRTFNGAPQRGVPDVPGSRAPVPAQGTAAPRPMGPAGGMVVTTPEEVLRIATRDHDAAVARYDGKKVRVTSLPGRIGISGNTMRLYADPSRYTASVVCLFEPDRMGELRSIPDGAAVTVEGDANIAGAERINIQNCHVVAIGGRPQQVAAPGRPPMGKYICMQSGQGIGDLTLAASTYTASGKSGSYSFDAASGRFRFTSGNYAEWGWTGVWKTDAQSPGGVPEPRIDITDGGRLNIHCYPPK